MFSIVSFCKTCFMCIFTHMTFTSGVKCKCPLFYLKMLDQLPSPSDDQWVSMVIQTFCKMLVAVKNFALVFCFVIHAVFWLLMLQNHAGSRWRDWVAVVFSPVLQGPQSRRVFCPPRQTPAFTWHPRYLVKNYVGEKTKLMDQESRELEVRQVICLPLGLFF